MTSPTLYVDVHILQDLPPPNINRDGQWQRPAQAVYVGVSASVCRRKHGSGQCGSSSSRRPVERGHRRSHPVA